MTPTISVLVAARRNSKYLAKFLMGYMTRTHDTYHTQLLVMLNEHDTWNKELVNYFEPLGVQFYYENLELGRAGLHEYFNELYKHAIGDWIIYFCEDHFITMDCWDNYLRLLITGSLLTPEITDQPRQYKNNRGTLDPHKVWCIVPKFDNAGAMNQVLSRGYCEAIGGVVGRHGWIDSYINDLNREAFGMAADRPNHKEGDRIYKLDDEMFHDFTHDDPNPMSDAHMQSVTEGKGKQLPKYTDPAVKHQIGLDAARLKLAIQGGL